ncbi:VanZ family protein [Lutibacter sp. B2]|nr:VanZ family protein [Lutibacter sp. B2]
MIVKVIWKYIFSYNFGVLKNMIVFMPFGFLIPFVFNKGRSLGKNIKISFLASSGVELLQFIVALGIFDVDDIILNVIGSMIGFSLYKLFIEGIKTINKEKILN